jgi:hypothetical protein
MEALRTLDGLIGRALRSLDGERAATSAAPAAPEKAELLASVDRFLSRGLDLARWWQRAHRRGAFADRFALGRTFNEPSRSFGFFDRAEVEGRSLPVMGNFQEMFYDRPKAPRDRRVDAARWMRDQMREFVLRYFMRVSDFRAPEGYAECAPHGGSGWPELLSWCPREDPARKGFGFEQLYYKRRDSGEIGSFPAAERFAIVDLREIGATYEWIVLKVSIFDFNFAFKPLGPRSPQLSVPLEEASYLVLSADLLRNEDEPEPGVLGRYGVGYTFVKNPTQGFFAFGPGEFDAAIERIDFEIRDDGQTRVAMIFVANRPERLVNLSFDPFGFGLRLADLASLGLASRLLAPVRRALGPLADSRLALDPVFAYVDLMNLLTGGAAAAELCISRDQLEKDFLVKHFMQHYQTIAGSLATWRLVGDWLDTAALPAWALDGRSSG